MAGLSGRRRQYRYLAVAVDPATGMEGRPSGNHAGSDGAPGKQLAGPLQDQPSLAVVANQQPDGEADCRACQDVRQQDDGHPADEGQDYEVAATGGTFA